MLVTVAIVLSWGLLLGAGAVLMRIRLQSASSHPVMVDTGDEVPSLRSRLAVALVVLPLAVVVCEWAAVGPVAWGRLLIGAALLAGIALVAGPKERR